MYVRPVGAIRHDMVQRKRSAGSGSDLSPHRAYGMDTRAVRPTSPHVVHVMDFGKTSPSPSSRRALPGAPHKKRPATSAGLFTGVNLWNAGEYP